MAILKIKRLVEDLENNTTQVLTSVGVANSGTAAVATLAVKATSAAQAGTSNVAHYASSGTAALAGTNAIFATGL
jgi:hypothetical protein